MLDEMTLFVFIKFDTYQYGFGSSSC